MSLLWKAAVKEKFFGLASSLLLGFLAFVFLFANVQPASALTGLRKKIWNAVLFVPRSVAQAQPVWPSLQRQRLPNGQ